MRIHAYVAARCVRVGDVPVGTAHTALFTAMFVHSGAKVPLHPDFAVKFKILIRLPPNSNTQPPGPWGTATCAGDPGSLVSQD
eukprot:6158052-Pyramimonas_sp.AAC.1